MTTATLVSQVAIALILFGGLFHLFYQPAKGSLKELPRIVFFAAVFIAGLTLNWVGISHAYGEDRNPGAILKFGAALSVTLKMFVLNWEWYRVEALSGDDLLYGIAVTFCYIAAVLGTSSLVVQLVFKNFGNSIRIFFLKHVSKKTYIIAGRGVRQKTLLKSLGPEQKRNTIIIPNETSEEAKKEYLAQGFLIINGKLDMETLKKAGFLDSRETTLIAISDDDVENLDIARTITKHIQDFPEKAANWNCSAHVMYTDIDRAEHFAFSEAAGGKIQFFNPCEITARLFLFENPITKFIHPSRIDTETARLKGRFDFLHVFIGFGKSNRELLKWSIITNQILGMDYRALVIDASIRDSRNAFMNQCRGLFPNGEEWNSAMYFPVPQEKYYIDFIECNALSKEMYDTIINRIKVADAAAVMISLENVQLSAEIAMKFRQRCYEEGIAEGINIFVHAKEYSPIVAEDVLNDNGIKIEPFGFEDEILTLDHIENRDMDILAKHIAESYSGAVSDEHPAAWDKLSNHERESNLYAAISIRAKLNLMGFDLIYDETGNSVQNKNTLKEFGRVYGLERAQRLRTEKDYLSYIERNADGTIADTVRNNLARLEHQRWNAYQLVKGWTPLPKNMVSATSRKDPRARKHACITTFEGLVELFALQASFKCEKAPTAEREARYHAALEDYDTMHLDCDQMDCLIGNLANTKYRIVKRTATSQSPQTMLQ